MLLTKTVATDERTTDVHQHLWPEPFLAALRARTTPPRLDGWTLHLAGEPPYRVRPADHDVAARAALDPGFDRVVLSLSSPLGIEYLPAEECAQLLDAWHAGAAALPEPFAAWASVHHAEPDLDGLARLLEAGFVGVQMPAAELADPWALERLAPVLRVAEQAGRAVFVHPSAAPVRPASEQLPPWWPAVVDYVGQLQAAWWTWAQCGRRLLPSVRICFAAGAGLAPLQHERFLMRGGGVMPSDPGVFVDTSSYGRQGLGALIDVLGIEALVLGSDRPYAEPTDPELGAAATRAVRVVNPSRLLFGS